MKTIHQVRKHNNWIRVLLLGSVIGGIIKAPSLYEYFDDKIEFQEVKAYHATLAQSRTINALINVNGSCKVYVEGMPRLFDCKSEAIEPGLYRVQENNNGFLSVGEYTIASEWSALTPETTYVISHKEDF